MVTRVGQGIMGGGKNTPLSAARSCGMGVPPSKALNMIGSPHLIIGYLLVRAQFNKRLKETLRARISSVIF